MVSNSVNGPVGKFALLFCLSICVAYVAIAKGTSVPNAAAQEVALAGTSLSSLNEKLVSPLTIASPPLLISEFRLRGPNGALDEFIEINNTSNATHTVLATTGTGYGIAASDGILRCTIPDGTMIPAHAHFLCTNSAGYTYGSYPAGDGTTATGDATYTTDIPDNVGIALFSTNLPGDFSLLTVIDAVGPATEANTLYKEGTGYATLTTSNLDYSGVRDNCGKQGNSATPGPCTSAGVPIDTNNNATDFYFVDTDGNPISGAQHFGSPGPKNLTSPTMTGSIATVLVDSTKAATVVPNRVRDTTPGDPNTSMFGTLEIRRRFVNSSGGNVTRLRFRIVDITTFPAVPGMADLRAITSVDVVVGGINDPDTCQGATPCAITVNGTTLETGDVGGLPSGGGWNSTLSTGTVTLGTPLTPGQSVDLRFMLGVKQTGNFRFVVLIEALP